MKAFVKQHNHLILNDRNLFTLSENTASQEVQQGVALLENIFLQSVISKVTWSHHLVLMNKIKDLDERVWYIEKALQNNWSKDIMDMQININLYQRQVKTAKVSNFNLTLPQPHSDLANYMMKDPYIFDFVSASKKANERDIENQLIQHITHFLLELGQGFAFVGRQYQLKVSDEVYSIDLLFYNIPLKSYVVIELKARDFDPRDAGQLNFYVNVVNAQLKTENDNPTIGLILCKGKNATLAEYALSGMTNPLGVADYKLTKAIPDDLRSKLPTIEELENELMETDLEE